MAFWRLEFFTLKEWDACTVRDLPDVRLMECNVDTERNKVRKNIWLLSYFLAVNIVPCISDFLWVLVEI
jgi:hypothetical protein